MKLILPKKVTRDAYVAVRAQFSEQERKDANNSWWNFQHKVSGIFDSPVVEDNTIGQMAQTMKIRDHGYCVGHVNLYSMKVGPINERLQVAN